MQAAFREKPLQKVTRLFATPRAEAGRLLVMQYLRQIHP
jgi:hypothetical protein